NNSQRSADLGAGAVGLAQEPVVIAGLDRLVLAQLHHGVLMLAPGGFELDPEVGDGSLQVGAAQARRLGKRRVGEVGCVLDARALLLGGDLAREIDSHVLEIRNHCFDRGDLARFLARLEASQPQCRIAWLHCSIPPTCTNSWLPSFVSQKSSLTAGPSTIKQATCQMLSERPPLPRPGAHHALATRLGRASSPTFPKFIQSH